MKLFSTLLLVVIVSIGFAQQFKIEENPRVVYTQSFKRTLSQAVITPTNKLVYCDDNVEIIDLNTGKVSFNWDPKGAYGESFISHDGKYVANRSQNYDHPTLGYVDAFQVLNTETKKEYLKPVPDELWQKVGFANTKEELVIQSYKYDGTDDKVRILTYDFVNGKEINTIFKSSKSSTIILDLEYSLDDKYIYATIAFSSSVSTFYVFNATSGDVVKKVPLQHQCDRIFVRDGKIFLSGAHGIKTTEYITILSSKDYSTIKEWKDEYAYNIDPKGEYTIKYNWDTKNLYVFDLSTGKETLLLEGGDYGFYILASSFDLSGNYFAVGKSNTKEYYDTADPNHYERAYILDNSLISNPVTSAAPEETTETSNESSEEVSSSDKWIDYSHNVPKLSVKLPGEAKVKEEKNSKGDNTITISGSAKTEAAMISIIEIPSIKSKKYPAAAKKIGENFVAKKTPENVKKSTYAYNDHEGVQYTFKIGKFEYIYRVFCADGYAFQLFYLASDIDQVDYETFFKSFDLK